MAPKRKPLAERFWPKVEKTETCWIWRGSRQSNGYGQINPGGDGLAPLRAHRVAYELVRGPIPDGLILDHLCRNPACVNPDHLEPVTYRENAMRGVSPKLVSHRTGICRRGHAMVTLKSGRKRCRVCARPSHESSNCAWRAKNQKKIAGYAKAWRERNPNYDRARYIARKEKANA